jgi:hypothetical protein
MLFVPLLEVNDKLLRVRRLRLDPDLTKDVDSARTLRRVTQRAGLILS